MKHNKWFLLMTSDNKIYVHVYNDQQYQNIFDPHY